MNAPCVKPAHSPFGGSVAARALCCPASVGWVEKVPENLRRSSAYADRGVALHAAIALLLDDDPPAINDLVGRTFGNYTLTSDDVENALRPAYAFVDALLALGAEFYLELRVTFPTIPSAFGTVDLIIRVGDTIYIIDF